jgi:hypothetical protein
MMLDITYHLQMGKSQSTNSEGSNVLMSPKGASANSPIDKLDGQKYSVVERGGLTCSTKNQF